MTRMCWRGAWAGPGEEREGRSLFPLGRGGVDGGTGLGDLIPLPCGQGSPGKLGGPLP